MKLTLELLSILGACEDGTNFAVRNNLIGMDLDRIIGASTKYRDCFGLMHWLASRTLTIDSVLYNDDGKITEIYKDGICVYLRRFDKFGNVSYISDENTVTEFEFDGDTIIETSTVTISSTDTKVEYKKVTKAGLCVFREKTNIGHKGSRFVTARTTTVTNGNVVVANEYQKLHDLILVNTLTYVDGVLKTKYMHRCDNTMHYNENGLPISQIDGKGNVVMSLEYDERSNNTNTSIFEGNNVFETVKEFDERNNMIASYERHTNRDFVRSRLCTYDDRGNIIRNVFINDGYTRTENYSYKFDSNDVLSVFCYDVEYSNCIDVADNTKSYSEIVL